MVSEVRLHNLGLFGLQQMWMVRSPEGQHADELLTRKIVGIGWRDCAEAAKSARAPEEFYAAVHNAYPEYRNQQIINAGQQLYKFIVKMKDGDDVMTYDSPARIYHVGKIDGPAETDTSLPEYFMHHRAVVWRSQIGRDALSLAARNSLGSSLTLFEPSEEAIAEIKRLIQDPITALTSAEIPAADTETEDPFANAMENSRELIKDKLMRLSWQEMQSLVAGILRAMGYKTRISPEGTDRGKDIVASPDGLGLEQPRIFVEVKHRKGQQMGAPEIRQFIGGRDTHNDRCLYVSTGGFTTQAKYEAERSAIPITLIDSDELVELLLEYYESSDSETRGLVPLRKTYWPA